MREWFWVSIIFIILFGIGLSTFFMLRAPLDFTFQHSSISAHDNEISESLLFTPDTNYHTLFRTFSSSINQYGEVPNSIKIETVYCEQETPYFYADDGCYMPPFNQTGYCGDYAYQNEYGCTSFDATNFMKGTTYRISSNYSLNPDNLFNINGNNYIKFIAYSSGNHPYLNSNNFKLSENIVHKKSYFPKEDVIIYIPYGGKPENFNIKSQNKFEYNPNQEFKIIFLLLPSILFVLVWFKYGREKKLPSVPDSLSVFNDKRKAWEVATYFDPPFAVVDDKFFSSILLELYQRKVIDVKSENKEIWIKLNAFSGDEIEEKIFKILENVKLSAPKENVEGEYFNFDKSLRSVKPILGPSTISAKNIKELFKELEKELLIKSKDYLDNKGVNVLRGILILCGIIGGLFSEFNIFIVNFISLLIISFVKSKSAILSKFKQDFYKEYLEWQSFKNYLNKSFTIKKGDYKASIIWDKYLVYSTALGVSINVVKELSEKGILSKQQVDMQLGVMHGGRLFSQGLGVHHSSMNGSSGGFGGAGGGGIGGGGGGGR